MLTLITTSVNYDDYLKLTLPHAVKWGRVIVATDTNDAATAQVVADNGAELYVTDAWYHNQDKFNKGRAMNEAIVHAKPQGWILLLDGDIILTPPPPDAQDIETLDETKLYGCRRLMCETAEQWHATLRDHNWFDLFMSPLPPVMGKGKNRRVWNHRPTKNPVGLQGYFQLYHHPTHPHTLLEGPTANNYDVELGLKWPDDKRELIPWPRYSVIHLGERKVNWSGRLSKRWDVSQMPEGELERAVEKHYDSSPPIIQD